MTLTTHWRVSLPSMTFALRGGSTPADWFTVTEAAPVARRCVGRPLAWALGYWRHRGATIEAMEA